MIQKRFQIRLGDLLCHIKLLQNIRKDSGLEVTDKIRVEVEDIEAVHDAAAEHGAYIGQQTLAVEVVCAAAPAGDNIVDSDVNDIPLKIAITKHL